MNKRKKVAWSKHRIKRKKLLLKRKESPAAAAQPSGRSASQPRQT